MRTDLIEHLDEVARLYPTRGVYGHKLKLLSRLFKHVQPDAVTFADSFSGTALVAWAAKMLGLEVRANDIMGFPSLRLRALVKNDSVTLSETDIALIETPNPDRKNWCERWYGLAMGHENAVFLDTLASNLSKLDSDTKRDVAVYIAILCLMGRMNYCAVTFTHLKTLTGKRNLRAFDLQTEFSRYAIHEFPLLVFSNGKDHRVSRGDALDMVRGLNVDCLYVDSPYCSPGGKYISDLGWYDKLALILQGHPDQVRNPYGRKPEQPPHTDFTSRQDALLGFAKLFMRAKGCRRIIVSYNMTSKVSPFEIVALAERHYGRRVAWEEITTGKPKASRDILWKSGEVLLVFDRVDQKPALTLVGRPAIEVTNPIRFIDLFCGGMGTIHMAGKRTGAECVFASEIVKSARKNYWANHGLMPAGDITRIDACDIPDHEICCGGFPCQAFSLAGKERAFNDARGRLFLEITRIARAKRPLVLFLENVDGLANLKNRKVLKAICDEIEAAGYDVHWKVLNSSYFGTATARRRIYFVCFRKDWGVSHFEFPQPTCELTSVKDYLLPDSETAKYAVKSTEIESLRWVKPKPKLCPLGKRDRCPHGTGDDCPLRTVRIGVVRDGSQGDRVYDSFHTTTITTGFASDIHLIDGKLRRLAPREMANVMGFPHDFILPSNDALARKFIGNSMAVPVVERIFKKIIETIESKGALLARRAA